MKPESLAKRMMRFAPYLAFFLSGASSLIFQTIWTRMLHHVFGATSVAISTVLTVFMAGLGLGTWISGRIANRIKHPIFTYAFAELGVAVWGLLIPFMVQSDGWLADMNAWLRLTFGAETSLFMIARFLCVVPILIVPTTLMGSTLPLLTRHFVSQESDPETASRNVGILYSLNTFGAATGPVLSAFVLLPNVGLSVTNIIACSMNFTLCVMIFALREHLIGSKWGSGVKLEVLPGPEEAASPSDTAEKAESKSEEKAERAEAEAVKADEGKDEPKAARKTGKKTKKGKAKSEGEAVASYRTAESGVEEEKTDAPKSNDDVWVPPIARKMAFVCFAASGAAALCYEVVWSRALAMCIGSSIYSFALILETFLIGIASGSAAMSAFLVKDSRRPLIGVAITAFALTLLANTPWAVDFHIEDETHRGDIITWIAVSLLPAVLLVATYMYAQRMQRAAEVLEDGAKADITAPGLVMVLVPLTVAGLNALYFHSGYLPKIIASVVAAVSVFLAIMLTLRRSPVLMLAVIQLYIALATVVSYIWQDEVPYAFAQLVVSVGDLPSHVGTVQFFMFVTAMLCTLPATLGMGAMFPLTMRVWTSGGTRIARDVSVVYTGNTIGSIVGSWLPGFVLMPLIGMERTLHAGILLNMLLALGMLIAGAAEPDKDGANKPAAAWVKPLVRFGVPGLSLVAIFVANALATGDASVRTNVTLGVAAIAFFVVAITWLLASTEAGPTAPPRGAGELPLWHAVMVYVLSPLIPALLALLWLGTSRPDAILRWNQTQMTLGVFRVSLAEGMLDPDSWGQPDLVYYHDGLSTTVTVERWGRHYALKNNGKVDASNGDDMPTQITVSAYPMLMHQQGPEGLDVAVIGFGSGVTVGTTLSFPVHSVDVIELERSIPEAARFFEDVNLLEYQLDHFPFVQMDRLTIINDDGRNYLASTDRSYDIIISEPSNPWITGVSDLFTVDHFRIAKQRLRPGGVYCQWVQLYEMSPENIKTIFRTFSEVYQNVVVFAADDRSSDTVVIGSDAPLTFDLERFQRVWALEQVPGRLSVPEQMERAYLHTPYDVFARVLLASRDEVRTYAQVEEHRHGDTWETDYASTNTRTCEGADCRRRAVSINTDDNAIIEFAAPRDLIGFERYEGYLSTIYSADWPFGRLEHLIDGFGEGDARARNLAELAMSLIGHGRYELAADFIEESQHAGRARETAVALEVLTHLLTPEHEPPIRIEAPTCGPEMDHDTCSQLMEGFNEVRLAVDRAQWGAALAAMEEIPSPLRLHSGPAMRSLYGYLLYKAAEGSFSQFRAAAESLEDLTRTEEDYCTTHPEVYYYLARSYDQEGEYGQALQQMRHYVEARLTTTHSDMVDTPEPPASEAPTTDVPGESDKTTHAD